MKCTTFLGCGLLLVIGTSAYTLGSKGTPVQKVLQMMGEMKVKAEGMKEAEGKTFRKYADWADDQQTELGFEIKAGTSEVEKLNAAIKAADLEVAKLSKAIAAMEKEIKRMETEMKESTATRTKENDIFLKTQQDLAESIDAIKRAQTTLKSGSQDQEATALLQSMSEQMPEALLAFIAEDEVGAPAAAAYKGQSSGVIAMLEGLEKKFKKELDELELAESNKANAYELEMQHLTDTVAATKADVSEKSAEKGKTAAESAKSKGELVKAKDELDEDKKMLVQSVATLKTKKALFQTNQKTRTEEIAAIAKAIEIISSPDVAAGYSKNINLAQATSLLQTQSTKRRVTATHRVKNLLAQRAALLSSGTLKSFADEVSGAPFTKVINLVKGMIAKLKAEASAEAEHKQWCDEQLKANKLTRDKQTTQKDKLEASIEKLNGSIDTMSKQIAKLVAEQAALTTAQKKASDIRAAEKASNAKTLKDAVAGAAATKQALTVLKKFYSAQAFVQQVPEMEKFGGQQGSSKGVMGMLEVIESDFLRLKAETAADEQQAQKTFDKFMSESNTSKEAKHAKETKLKLDKDKAENDKSTQSKDLVLTKEKLGKANKYYETLKPTCVEIHVDFAERSARRKEEIEALKEAYGILDTKGD